MEKLDNIFALALAASGLSVPVNAQEAVSLVGVWSIGETRSCDAGAAWVFFADGFYAEVQLPESDPSAVGVWRDEGEMIAYTHAHMPFEGHERPMRVRHFTVEERIADRLRMRNYRGDELIFHRCPAQALKAPPSQGGH